MYDALESLYTARGVLSIARGCLKSTGEQLQADAVLVELKDKQTSVDEDDDDPMLADVQTQSEVDVSIILWYAGVRYSVFFFISNHSFLTVNKRCSTQNLPIYNKRSFTKF